MKKIAIIQRQVPDYRVKFYNDLYISLLKKNISLTVYAGEAGSTYENQFLKCSINNLKFGKKIRNILLFKSLYWQNIFFKLQNYDMVICEQANSALINYPLIFWRRISNKKPIFAYWGHALTLDKKSSKLSSYIKKKLILKSDYWFAYTLHTKRLLMNLGFKVEKIKTVDNSIDMSQTHSLIEKNRFHIKKNNKFTLITCSRLTKSKDIPFIIEACEIAKRKIKKLNLIIIGDGPEKKLISKICKSKSWIQLKGSLYNLDKSKALIEADAMCIPSHVGLSILDGFSAMLPALVTNENNHCPEIEYFEDGYNGLICKKDLKSYAKNIIKIFENKKLREELSLNALKTSKKYSHENMTNNFLEGIISALEY